MCVLFLLALFLLSFFFYRSFGFSLSLFLIRFRSAFGDSFFTLISGVKWKIIIRFMGTYLVVFEQRSWLTAILDTIRESQNKSTDRLPIASTSPPPLFNSEKASLIDSRPIQKLPVMPGIPSKLQLGKHTGPSSSSHSLPTRTLPVTPVTVTPTKLQSGKHTVPSSCSPTPIFDQNSLLNSPRLIQKSIASKKSQKRSSTSLSFDPPQKKVACVTNPCSPTSNSLNNTATISSLQANRIERKLDVICEALREITPEIRIIMNSVCAKEHTVPHNFYIEKIWNESSLIEFNSRLEKDTLFMGHTITQLGKIVGCITDVDKRLKIVLDLLFDNYFLRKCSWTGRGIRQKKVQLSQYTYVLHLFKFVGGTKFLDLTDEHVKNFFVNKLYNCGPKHEDKGVQCTVVSSRDSDSENLDIEYED
ncbi:uncharacterized protein LOC125771475 [Anopheles funestus]|uniref:uncharacterized protein LOC125771475 n=1 Tax=Anopheles funestus TaxID=62324 RepID=UPI0020C67271|nr:uncharacterized protein LOC125771475 [Anopheles funestus]